MLLNVQQYLNEKSLENLKIEFGVDYSEFESLVVLNYNQIDSPKDHLIVLECRGLVLEKNSWRIISYPFRRFFNYSEVPRITDTFDFTKAVGLEKLDGSLISVFNYNDKWLMSTRGMIENESCVGLTSITFKDLFYKTTEKYPNFWKNISKSFIYCFEITSPENRVVTIYKDRQLHLLMMRRIITWEELPLKNLKEWSIELGIDLPKIETFADKNQLLDLVKSLAALDEGFVAVDYTKNDDDNISFKRVKVKNPSYVAIHHIKSKVGSSLRSVISLVIDNQIDEFLGYFSEFTEIVMDVKAKYDAYIQRINSETEQFKEYFSKSRKEFALAVKDCANPSYMFQLYDNKVKTILEFFDNLEKMKSRKYLEKYLVEKLKLKDITFSVEL